MPMAATQEDVQHLVETLNFAEKVERSLRLIERAYDEYGDRLVVANSLGKDSSAVWHLAGRVSDRIRGFIVTTRFKPSETKRFMREELDREHGRLEVYDSTAEIPDDLYRTDPDRCCEILKVEPTWRALEEMGAACWGTGLRCTEGRTRTDYQEIEERDRGLVKLNPILLWSEREVWQYLALNRVPVNPLYGAGYRSLGCEPCSHITTGRSERAGRWIGTSKCGGECGIHTRSLKGGQE
jgi:phosphoadenylyl-sulfate reductase (thioredoxin)